MAYKILTRVLAAAMFIVFVGPVVVKLKDVALSTVVLIGLTMLVVDLWQSAKSRDD